MNTITEAKERVCKSLLNRVSHYDDLLEETDLSKDKDKITKLYSMQYCLITRLERVLNH